MKEKRVNNNPNPFMWSLGLNPKVSSSKWINYLVAYRAIALLADCGVLGVVQIADNSRRSTNKRSWRRGSVVRQRRGGLVLVVGGSQARSSGASSFRLPPRLCVLLSISSDFGAGLAD
ncbi:unnamed protein product [Cuscuta epithymum]|uniref:Uncharacterized protein n=1 Tax=Cuscuta epithymum TaxID=186058 RepID=A0AAV0CS92_9ASTE|nr:unnamed protein product [Cuscuta epithymum]